jgi:hypothetical protein
MGKMFDERPEDTLQNWARVLSHLYTGVLEKSGLRPPPPPLFKFPEEERRVTSFQSHHAVRMTEVGYKES